MARNGSSLGDEEGIDAIELQAPSGSQIISSTIDDGRKSHESSTPANVAEYPSGPKLIAITTGLVLSIFLAALDSTIIATAIPSITDEFGTIRNIAWYGSAYLVTSTAFPSAWGKAYRYFPLKRVFLLAIAIFELGNVVSATASNSNLVILGRVIAGIGGGGVMTGSFIIIAFTVKPKHRPAYMGILGVTFGCASVVGPLMGGALTDGPGWRWCFWVSLPIGAVAASIMFLFFSAPPNPQTEMSFRSKLAHTDLQGGVLVAGALSCFVMAMHWAGTLPWSSAQIVGCLSGFGAMAVVFICNEYLMGPMAMVQSHLFWKRGVLLNLAFIFFLAGVFFPLVYILPVRFQSINNDSAAQSGVRLIPLVLGVSFFTMLVNGLLIVWRHFHPLLVLSAVFGTAGVSAIYAIDGNISTATWIGLEILTAAGVGIALQIPMIANQTLVAHDDVASVTALTLFMENVGTTLFVAAGEAAFTSGMVASLHRNVPGLDPNTVVDAGVTQLRAVFYQPAELAGILRAYLDGCRTSHIISVACGVGTALVSLVGAWPVGVRVLQTRLQKPHVP